MFSRGLPCLSYHMNQNGSHPPFSSTTCSNHRLAPSLLMTRAAGRALPGVAFGVCGKPRSPLVSVWKRLLAQLNACPCHFGMLIHPLLPGKHMGTERPARHPRQGLLQFKLRHYRLCAARCQELVKAVEHTRERARQMRVRYMPAPNGLDADHRSARLEPRCALTSAGPRYALDRTVEMRRAIAGRR